jgi:hypothetical protein
MPAYGPVQVTGVDGVGLGVGAETASTFLESTVLSIFLEIAIDSVELLACARIELLPEMISNIASRA